MKKIVKILITITLGIVMFSSCTMVNQTMREPNTRLQWAKADFTYSDQVWADATTTRILGIDWKRIFKKKMGTVQGEAPVSILNIDIAAVPVLGGMALSNGGLVLDRTINYALYNLMQSNPGYDVVFYPQYEITVNKPAIFGIIYKRTKVKVTARLAKIN